MRLLIFITILLIPTVVSSSGECVNPELECIELCCEETQYYDEQLELCDDIPEYADISWDTLLHDNNTISQNISETMELVEYGECETTESILALIPFCYSPYYYKKSKQFVLKKFSDVPCDRLEMAQWFSWGIYGLVFVLPFCLPIMMVYTCKKGLNEKLTFKLVSWYFMSMVASILTTIAAVLSVELPKDLIDVFEKYADTLSEVFFIATSLWLNVIGYQMWIGFKQANAQDNSDKDRRRFICYSIYVWGISMAITTLNYLLFGKSQLSRPWEIIYGGWELMAPASFNLVTFVFISVNICMIRCRVANLIDQAHFKRQLLFLILRISLMMGIPRMLVILWAIFFDVNETLVFVVEVLEPFVIFIVLVLKPKHYFKWNFLCCCCGKTEEISNVAEVVYLNTNRH